MAVIPEIKLKRFLHYGREFPFYQPGDRILNKYFEPTCITAIESLIADGKSTEAVGHIVKAFSDGYSAHSESLVFALAFCARNELLRNTAYNAFKTVCKSPKHFFLFIKFASDLKKAPIKSGWGAGYRRVVNDWYLKQTPMELAESVTRYRCMYFWSHKDILKLTHPKTDDVAMKAVLMYVIKGLNVAQEEYNSVPEAQQILNYLQMVEDFKHCQEGEQAARLLEQHKLSIEHVPSHLMKSKEVWTVLVSQIPLAVLLKNLKRLGRMRFLRPNHPVLVRVLEALQNQAAITEGAVHPAQVLIALRGYEQSGRLKYTDPSPAGVLKPPPPPNPKVIEALYQVLASSYKLLVPTGLRYLVMMDTRAALITGRCWLCPSVAPFHAATLLALALVKAERDITVMAFGIGAPSVIPITKEMSQQEAQDKIRETPTSSVDLTSPLVWALANKKAIDVFIAITDNQVKTGRIKVMEKLTEYRKTMNIPNAKFVVCGLACPKFSIACEEDPGMLDVAGFDAQVPRVIEAFSRGAF